MDSEQRLEELRRQAEDQRKAAEQLQEQLQEDLAAREFTAKAADGSVEVTVDGNGSPRRVHVDPKRLNRIKGDELGRGVVEALQLARKAAQEGTTDIQERAPGGADGMQQLRRALGFDSPES